MSNLPIKELKPEQAELMNFESYIITLKLDGSLMYYNNGKLFSPRCDRSERFSHILTTLKNNNMPNCYGEVYIGEDKNVFDVSRSENWRNALFCPIDLIDNKLSLKERQEIIKNKVSEINSFYITELKKFDSFKEGWNYVKENNREGLVIRNDNEFYKVKILKEVKEEIVSHLKGTSLKGTFILLSGNKVSGTSESYVKQYLDIVARGNKAIGEIEFPFLTEDNKYFQPRLRLIREVLK
jgi:hypothetical protein